MKGKGHDVIVRTFHNKLLLSHITHGYHTKSARDVSQVPSNGPGASRIAHGLGVLGLSVDVRCLGAWGVVTSLEY